MRRERVIVDFLYHQHEIYREHEIGDESSEFIDEAFVQGEDVGKQQQYRQRDEQGRQAINACLVDMAEPALALPDRADQIIGDDEEPKGTKTFTLSSKRLISKVILFEKRKPVR